MIRIEKPFLKSFVDDDELKKLQPNIDQVVGQLQQGTCPGNDFLGWMDLPDRIDKDELEEIKAVATYIRNRATQFVSIGIGGSYLGARAAIKFLSRRPSAKPSPEILFLGHHLSADYTAQLLRLLRLRKTYINVISKSGTTTEPAIAFRLLRTALENALSDKEVVKHIIVTTDKDQGALRRLADEKGYKSFIIPDDVGGRFSVLTPVGLLPIAVAGIDIDELLRGARDMAALCKRENNLFNNPALLYAAIRYRLYQQGKSIEILANFEPQFRCLAEWWKQLFGESEGKDNKGLFPASVNLTTDLHSLGQYIQQGKRLFFETFLIIDRSAEKVVIPETADNLDKMNYLSGSTLHEIDHQAYRGTALAHYDGGVPNLTIRIPERTPYYLGQLFYFFEYAVAVSGLLLGVNPFDQPGVEMYKENMFALMGKPGFDDRREKLEKRQNENS